MYSSLMDYLISSCFCFFSRADTVIQPILAMSKFSPVVCVTLRHPGECCEKGNEFFEIIISLAPTVVSAPKCPWLHRDRAG